jgi:hypothetical protein
MEADQQIGWIGDGMNKIDEIRKGEPRAIASQDISFQE